MLLQLLTPVSCPWDSASIRGEGLRGRGRAGGRLRGGALAQVVPAKCGNVRQARTHSASETRMTIMR